METKANLIEPLLEKAEQFGKTNLELLKLKSVDKAAEVGSSLISNTLLLLAFSIFLLVLNIAIALWLGDLLGKAYYGFSLVALFYGLVLSVLFFMRKSIKASVRDSIITQILSE